MMKIVNIIFAYLKNTFFIGDIHNYVKKIVFKYNHKLIPIQVPAMNWVYLY